MLENVMELKPGMTLEEVNDTLDLSPYNIKSRDSSGNYTIIYKYRVYDRSTIPFFLKRKNGIITKGGFITLLARFNKDNILTSVYTCTGCEGEDLKEKKINVAAIVVIVTVILPAVLVIIGLK